ncbi:MAG: UDP-3-O-(3-hydroxymyristoyl)glucosamine N-acyltransferase, partial [Planctomycetes bacterium]|nr:UDP-3-O-(3-hydroxymyristoyl)glucosamine N-acyltransferase [Planctomycetota bacterium]
MTRKTLADLAALCGAVLEGDGSVEVRGPAPLADAGPDQVSFLAHPKYAGQLADTSAAAVLMGEGVAEVPAGINILRHGDPGQAFTKIILAFRPPRTPMPAGVHPSAVVHGEAQVSPGVSIGPCCTVGAGTVLSDGVILHGGVHLAEETSVGRNSELHPGVVLYPGTSVGANCLIHAGAVLGADGFGFEPSAASGASGTGVAGWQKVPQCGTVEIGDCVEIGANCAIDRGRFGPTRIGSGSKLDNLVHVAH